MKIGQRKKLLSLLRRIVRGGERRRRCEAPAHVVIDEFTSVVDRQIARIGASSFAKAWRRTDGQAALLSCHYEYRWLAPDWILDTATRVFRRTRGCLQRPRIKLDIFQTNILGKTEYKYPTFWA